MIQHDIHWNALQIGCNNLDCIYMYILIVSLSAFVTCVDNR